MKEKWELQHAECLSAMCQRIVVFQGGSVFAVVQYLPLSSFDVMKNFIDK